MTTARIISTMPSSFVHENLVTQVQAIQNQMVEIENILDDRWKNEKKTSDEFKCRSLTFIDPYGNPINDDHMDHELISKIIRKYKKDYIPKYLQQWIKIGTMNENTISSLNDSELKSNVSQYANGYQFITYGEVTVWIRTNRYS